MAWARPRGVSGPKKGETPDAPEHFAKLPLSDAIAVLKACIESQQPVILWGPPGIGKTAFMTQISDELGRGEPVVLILSIIEPQDVGGIPFLPKTTARGGAATKRQAFEYAPPAWINRLGKNGILFLDELTTAPPQTQAAALRILGERVVGMEKLPEKVAVVAAANPVEQAVGGSELMPPLANRLIHLYWPVPTPTEWANWADKNLKLSPLAKRIVRALVNDPENIKLMGTPVSDEAWASPRSWARGLTALSAAFGSDTQLNKRSRALLAGAVGYETVVALEHYLRQNIGSREILDGEEIPDRAQAGVLLRGVARIGIEEPALAVQAFERILKAADTEGYADAATGALIEATASGPTLPLLRAINDHLGNKAVEEYMARLQQSPVLFQSLNVALAGEETDDLAEGEFVVPEANADS